MPIEYSDWIDEQAGIWSRMQREEQYARFLTMDDMLWVRVLRHHSDRDPVEDSDGSRGGVKDELHES